ncbi:MAG: T9SS type A sorting domain-containing protein [candidate division Zixibacteria bacterium]|nr:T9SS type A sorting domain-containing protein [candidate division Zixibacteria bacterium]
MKKLTFLAIGIMLLMALPAFAQDPGSPDSIIIDTTYAPWDTVNYTTRYVHVYFVTDDSIMFLNLPITWTSPDGQVFPGRSVWRAPFTGWDDCWDTLLIEQRLLRQVCWADLGGEDNPPLFTNGIRLWGLDLRFVATPSAVPQFVFVDTCTDPINGKVEMANVDITFRPKIKGGYFRYGSIGIDDNTPVLPSAIALNQNYPNPFNPETNIEFALPKGGNVSIEVFNVLGQKVKTLISEYKDAGTYSVRWDGTNNNGMAVPSGVYFYRMVTEGFSQTNKMIMLR